MTELALDMSGSPPIDRRRRLAWQISLVTPCVVLLLVPWYWSSPPPYLWQTACGLLTIGLVLTAAVTDVRWHKIPNWATYTACGWAWLINGFALFADDNTAGILGAVGLLDSLTGAVIPFMVMLVIFSLTGGGAGDVKLTAALGALLGLDLAIDAILLSFIVAGGFALIRGVWLQGPINLLVMAYRSIGSWVLPLWILPPNKEQQAFMKQPMPLGPSFALGAGLVLFHVDIERVLSWVGSQW